MAAFEIRDLSFTYPNENKPALEHVTLDIPEGQYASSAARAAAERARSCAE